MGLEFFLEFFILGWNLLRFCCGLAVTLEIKIGEGDVMNIMLVDGNAQALSLAAKRLTEKQAAITLFLYTNARDAVKFAIYNNIDIVYARQTLPEMSGAGIADHIRRFHPDVQCHILGDGEDFPSIEPFLLNRLVQIIRY